MKVKCTSIYVLLSIIFAFPLMIIIFGVRAFGSNHNEHGEQIRSHKAIHIYFILFIITTTCCVLSSISVCAQHYVIFWYNERVRNIEATENIEIVTDEN